jgi:hypothetical protein
MIAGVASNMAHSPGRPGGRRFWAVADPAEQPEDALTGLFAAAHNDCSEGEDYEERGNGRASNKNLACHRAPEQGLASNASAYAKQNLDNGPTGAWV